MTPINTATNKAGKAITVGTPPVAIAITPNGKTAYVANSNGDRVTPINTATNTTAQAITVGSTPMPSRSRRNNPVAQLEAARA